MEKKMRMMKDGDADEKNTGSRTNVIRQISQQTFSNLLKRY